ncbi:hypothetical protein Bbelb_283140 [Branchiostoma belcheri]|nr:hypothetical protein Bbelb_283140 [Branchiostoma belcheri]
MGKNIWNHLSKPPRICMKFHPPPPPTAIPNNAFFWTIPIRLVIVGVRLQYYIDRESSNGKNTHSCINTGIPADGLFSPLAASTTPGTPSPDVEAMLEELQELRRFRRCIINDVMPKLPADLQTLVREHLPPGLEEEGMELEEETMSPGQRTVPTPPAVSQQPAARQQHLPAAELDQPAAAHQHQRAAVLDDPPAAALDHQPVAVRGPGDQTPQAGPRRSKRPRRAPQRFEDIRIGKGVSLQKVATVLKCRHEGCDRVYVRPRARVTHELKKHNPVVNEAVESSSDTSKEHYVFNYHNAKLGMSLLLTNIQDAKKEGDGERVARYFRMAHSLLWDRFVNTRGGGKNIAGDLRLEHMNNLLKSFLKRRKRLDRLGTLGQQEHGSGHARFGIKLWVLADSTNGYISRFEVYRSHVIPELLCTRLERLMRYSPEGEDAMDVESWITSWPGVRENRDISSGRDREAKKRD